MEHPFLGDISDKTIEELQDSISSLNQKLSFAYRTSNGPMIHQIQMLLEGYRNQINKKMDEMFSKQKINNPINIEQK